MITKKNAAAIIKSSINEFNLQNPTSQIQYSSDAILFGKSGILNSLGLVNLIVEIEQNVEEKLEVSIILASEKAMSFENSPFRTIDTLTNYTLALIEEALNG